MGASGAIVASWSSPRSFMGSLCLAVRCAVEPIPECSRGAQAVAFQVLQSVPLSRNAADGASLPVLVPVKPMVTDADGAMVPL